VKMSIPQNMIKFLIGALICIVVPLSAGAARAASEKWHPIAVAEGRFRVDMPAEPARETKQSGTVVGTVNRVKYTCKVEDATYQVQFMDLPGIASMFASPKSVTDRMKKDYTKSGKGKVVSESEVEISGKKGRELVIALSSGGTATARSLQVGSRLYIVSYENADAQNGQRFLASFHLID
jgi:hypothetical protein